MKLSSRTLLGNWMLSINHFSVYNPSMINHKKKLIQK
jgi:hypothetical protein